MLVSEDFANKVKGKHCVGDGGYAAVRSNARFVGE